MKIWTGSHTYFAAKSLAFQLEKLGIKSEIIREIDVNSSEIHIIIGAHSCRRFPKNYIIWQTEVAGSHHFSKKYLLVIQKALSIWDYSEKNQDAYFHEHKSIIYPSILHQKKHPKDIDYLFYGWIEGSKRRMDIINELRRGLNIKVFTNCLEARMWQLLNRSKVVINIHYYENSPLELFRITEALSHNCHVVSEKSNTNYIGVTFADKPKEIISKAKILKDKYFEYDFSKQDNLEEIKKALAIVI